ncbi:group 1 glycosyl transferase [Candidatus Moduliflexus flocculans]|uniref:Group 1 glycosyl transferase n=1 Tax=Candidatus Moduliflexus flocculans TaxID=1499966 RepID=A0A0S6W3D7_9BACT|nr:group 1 glycosyl transferase [Candidatus Moduliflexus flocculans]
MVRVAIVHYHLHPGGVTRVIQQTLAALAAANSAIRTVTLTGEPPQADMPIEPYVVVEWLRYGTTLHAPISRLADELRAAATQALGGRPDIWHIHNHALGKNLTLPAVVAHLAEQGERLLLHIHDFAEDGRPANYRLLQALCAPLPLYPQGTHVMYGVLNQRDHRFLAAAGVSEAQLRDLPNPIHREAVSPPGKGKGWFVDGATSTLSRTPPQPLPGGEYGGFERLILYSVRGIRRKNLGEFLLWSALAESDETFALTRAPQNPAEQPRYAEWVALAEALRLPVTFDLGKQWAGTFDSLIAAASAIMTTSVAEGFGLTFLEPWLADREVVGRKLPEITAEFEQAGIDLSGLYDHLWIPLEWIGRERFEQEIRNALPPVYAAYSRVATPDDMRRAVNAAINGDMVDMGRLSETLQQDVISQATQSAAKRAEIRPARLLTEGKQTERIRRNREIIERQFHLSGYGARLRRIYEDLAAAPITALPPLDPQRLLDQFLAPERFCLLRT